MSVLVVVDGDTIVVVVDVVGVVMVTTRMTLKESTSEFCIRPPKKHHRMAGGLASRVPATTIDLPIFYGVPSTSHNSLFFDHFDAIVGTSAMDHVTDDDGMWNHNTGILTTYLVHKVPLSTVNKQKNRCLELPCPYIIIM
jgi:hypothetical protein